MSDQEVEDPRYRAAVAFLMGRVNYERSQRMPSRQAGVKLEQTHRLLELLGNPHHSLPCLHVAGTKGKGSTASMLAAMLQAAGYRTGLYTSPHIERIEERFVVDGTMCSPGELTELVEQIAPAAAVMDAEGRRPTFFELTTALAFLYFMNKRTDLVVLEVGLGGRLDSTNVCRPIVCVITNISRDHMRQLGNTVAEIAREKAGIIKPGVPLVSGAVDAEAETVIAGLAEAQGAPLVTLHRQFGVLRKGPTEGAWPGRCRFDFWIQQAGRQLRVQNDLEVNLLGEHQVMNAAVALAALEQLPEPWRVPEEARRAGLGRVVCPARIELVSREPIILLDTAHNLASAQALRATLDDHFPGTRRWLILTATEGKDVRGILRELIPCFQQILLTRYHSNPRGMDPARLWRQAVQVLGQHPTSQRPNVAWYSDARSAILSLQSRIAAGDVVVMTGSFYFAGEARRLAASLALQPASHVPSAEP